MTDLLIIQWLLDRLGDLRNILWHITPALTTVAVGGFLLQRFFVRRANASAFIDVILKNIQQLQDDSLNYWGRNDSAENKVIAQKIKAGIDQLESHLLSFGIKYGEGWFSPCSKKRLFLECDPVIEKLSETATGGEFEVGGRLADPARTLRIVNCLNTLRTSLLNTKF